MKISIQEDKFHHTVDYSVNDKIEGGFLEEYFPDPKEVIDDFLHLLGNVYSRERIDEALKDCEKMGCTNPCREASVVTMMKEP